MNMSRETRHNAADVIASYVDFLTIGPEQNQRRRQLIEEVVSDCDARYRWLMYSVIRAIGLRHEDAEDVLQEILLRWTRQLEAGRNLPAPEALTAWLRAVARFAAINYLRRLRGKRKKAEDIYGRRRFTAEAEQSTPLDDLALRELPEVIAGILERRCTQRMRLVFSLRWEEETYAEIAKNLDEGSEEAVRGVMRRIVDILEEELTRLGWAD
jgi:RNA polymerase sigma factor (sigma-70 family)